MLPTEFSYTNSNVIAFPVYAKYHFDTFVFLIFFLKKDSVTLERYLRLIFINFSRAYIKLGVHVCQILTKFSINIFPSTLFYWYYHAYEYFKLLLKQFLNHCKHFEITFTFRKKCPIFLL